MLMGMLLHDPYQASPERYNNEMQYARSGSSGLLLPKISLGLWHNFGDVDALSNQRALLRDAFDHGITHFDLANNYGPPPGSAESNFGRLFKEDFRAYREELVISSKAGYRMWEGPYGEWGSRKNLIGSLDQSLQRMGLDYVDVFYHHRPDPDTPLEETMSALDYAVRSGKALYVGISNYGHERAEEAICLLRKMGTPCLIHQARYNLFDRKIEPDLLPLLDREGVGCIVFSPLAQGMLTDRYLGTIPSDSRAASEDSPFLNIDQVKDKLPAIEALNAIAQGRGQSLAEMALAWCVHRPEVTSVLIGASRVSQLQDNLKMLENATFTDAELAEIDAACQVNGGAVD